MMAKIKKSGLKYAPPRNIDKVKVTIECANTIKKLEGEEIKEQVVHEMNNIID